MTFYWPFWKGRCHRLLWAKTTFSPFPSDLAGFLLASVLTFFTVCRFLLFFTFRKSSYTDTWFSFSLKQKWRWESQRMKRTVQEIYSNWALGTYVSVHRENFNVTQVMKVTPPCHGLRCQTSGKRRGLNMRSASHLRSLLRCCGHVSFPATSLSSAPGGQHLPCARQPLPGGRCDLYSSWPVKMRSR